MKYNTLKLFVLVLLTFILARAGASQYKFIDKSCNIIPGLPIVTKENCEKVAKEMENCSVLTAYEKWTSQNLDTDALLKLDDLIKETVMDWKKRCVDQARH